MRTPSTRYKHTVQETEFSLSDLALKFINKADRGLSKTKRGLGKARNGVKLYKKNPTAFKIGAVALVGLVMYLTRKDDKREDTGTSPAAS